MNYRQQLIYEAVQELRQESPEVLTHVSDITCDWADKSKDVVYWLVYKGTAYPIHEYHTQHYQTGSLAWKRTYKNGIELYGEKKKTDTDPAWRQYVIKEIKDYITKTVAYAEKNSADRRGFDSIYPGLAQ